MHEPGGLAAPNGEIIGACRAQFRDIWPGEPGFLSLFVALGRQEVVDAYDDLVFEILETMSHLVIAGMRGNAGAGGAMMALAADQVYARSGNCHQPTLQEDG